MKSNISYSEDTWNALMDAAVDAIVITDIAGTVEYFSKAAETMFMYKADKVVGENINMLVPPRHKGHHSDYISRYLLTGQAKVIGQGKITEGMKSDGSIFPIKLSIGEVTNTASPQFIGIIHDLTEQEKYRLDVEKIREKFVHIGRLNAIGELVEEVVHEMNQPITAIQCYAKACINLALNNSAEHLVEIVDIQEKIETQLIRAIAINQRLRNFVKTRGGHRESVSINELIDESIELIKIDSRHINHPIIKRSQNVKNAFVFVDPVQIQQVILNLVRNAMDAMDAMENEIGSIFITIQWLDNQTIQISVEDQGCGINDDVVDKIFNPFVSTKPVGMGMGLSVSQNIVNTYGGDIIFSKNKEKGVTFSFSLPSVDVCMND